MNSLWMLPLLLLTNCTLRAQGKRRRVYFREEFEDGDGWTKRWVQSKHQSDYGKFQLTAGKFYQDKERDKGLQTSEDAKFYALSTRFKPFSNVNETLVVQFSVKHEQGIDCGGGYVKLFPATLNQEDMHSESQYYIMFGCKLLEVWRYTSEPRTKRDPLNACVDYVVLDGVPGTSSFIWLARTSVALAITDYRSSFITKGNTMRTTRPSSAGLSRPRDVLYIHTVGAHTGTADGKTWEINKDTHLYTLILRPNATYEVKIDNEKVTTGGLEDDWDFLPPRKIKDPYARKPRKWDERLQIEDPDDKKPEDWEDSEFIPDPEAKKPDDWNEAMDGVWEGPLIPNVKYKGQWKPRIIDNPNYQGEWIHPEIDNPKYRPDPTICHYYNISVLGLDLWQVKSGSIFDNFLLTNDEEFAEEVGNMTWGLRKDVEQQWRELYEEMEKKKEAEEAKKKREKERARKEDIWGLDEEDEEDNEEDSEEEPDAGPKQEDSAKRASLGEKEVRFDQKDEL